MRISFEFTSVEEMERQLPRICGFLKGEPPKIKSISVHQEIAEPEQEAPKAEQEVPATEPEVPAIPEEPTEIAITDIRDKVQKVRDLHGKNLAMDMVHKYAKNLSSLKKEDYGSLLSDLNAMLKED